MGIINFNLFFRNLGKQKIITGINILGLVIGIASLIFILEYIFYEKSYDSFHKNADNTYRIVYDRYRENTLLWKTVNTFYPTGTYLKKTFPEVVDFVNIIRNYNIEASVVRSNGEKINFFEEKSYFASTSFFEVFTFPLAQGSPDCLSAPNTAAISRNAARKYFGHENPVGKVITLNSKDDYTVTAVFDDFPSNSHIKTDMLFSISTITTKRASILTNWESDGYNTYVQLLPGTDYKAFERRAFTRMIADNYKDIQDRMNDRDIYHMQPLKSIHLNSAIEYELETPGNETAVNVLFGFALFFIIIAWVNYINLVTARSVERAKEIGVRKVNGASQNKLIIQFVGESVLFNLICLILAAITVVLINPLFKQITGLQELNILSNTKFWIYTLIVLVAGILLSSVYPALILSSYDPVTVLKGKFRNSKQGFFFRKGLVTFQFFVSISMLIGTGIIYQQVKFLSERDKGYAVSSALVFKSPRIKEADSVFQTRVNVFRDQIMKIPGVNSFTYSSDIPGQEISNFYGCYRKGLAPDDENYYFRVDVDASFVHFFKVKLLAGRNFIEDMTEKEKIMVNVQALKRIGFHTPEEAVGQVIISGEKEREIIGVLDDMNYYSAKVEAVPTIFTPNTKAKRYLVVKYQDHIQPGSAGLIKDQLKEAYVQVFPGSAIEYFPLEDKINQTMKPDHTFAFIFGIFSVLAVIISVIGILGLVMITINQNIKEMGVRKVLGAGLIDFTSLLMQKFKWQIIIAMLTSLPVSYFVYRSWVLDNYVYRIDLHWIYFLMPILLIWLLITLTIGFVSVYISSLRPVESLRYE